MNKITSHRRSNNKRAIFLNKDSLVQFKCPICTVYTRKVKLIPWWGRSKLRVMSCSCRTIFFPGARAPNYQVVEDETSFYLRLDQAEGIDAAISPVFVSPELKDFAVVDVGCGLGFDLANPFHVVEKLNKATLGDRIIPSARESPYNLAIIFYLSGFLLISQSHDSGATRVYFESAMKISEMYSRIFEKQNFQLFGLEIQNVRNWSLREIPQHCL